MQFLFVNIRAYPLVFFAVLFISAQSDSAEQLGSSLHKKEKIAVSDIPVGVVSKVKEVKPGMVIFEAEKELKNGVTYYDVEGTDKNGNDIELDLTQEGKEWKVVEIQRDIILKEVPEIVQIALEKNVPSIKPGRIIESDQGDGVIIYEFYTRSELGNEHKYEVKYEKGLAEYLKKEWKH